MAQITLRILKFIYICLLIQMLSKNTPIQGTDKTKVPFLYYSCSCIN